MIRMTGRATGRKVFGFGITKADMARLLQGERLVTQIAPSNGLPPFDVLIFGGEDELSLTLDWQKHMTKDTQIHMPPQRVIKQ